LVQCTGKFPYFFAQEAYRGALYFSRDNVGSHTSQKGEFPEISLKESIVSKAHPIIIEALFLWERCGNDILCQAGMVCQRIAADRFAGVVVGYVGGGVFLQEPFVAHFDDGDLIELIIGENDVLNRKEVPSETWPTPERQAVMRGREWIKQALHEAEDGLFQATPSEQAKIRWSSLDHGTGVSIEGNPETILWDSLRHHTGLA
jgi:hypothetical protein